MSEPLYRAVEISESHDGWRTTFRAVQADGFPASLVVHDDAKHYCIAEEVTLGHLRVAHPEIKDQLEVPEPSSTTPEAVPAAEASTDTGEDEVIE